MADKQTTNEQPVQQQSYTQLEERLRKVEAELASIKGSNFEEKIRDIVFFDQDTTTVLGSTVVTNVTQDPTTKVITVTTGTVPSISNALKFVRIYFRGQVFNVLVSSIS